MRTPQRITSLEGQLITKVSCGDMHSLALGASGDVFMWGLLPETRHVRNDGMFDHASVSLTGMDQAAMSREDLRANMSENIMSRLMRDSELVYESANMLDGVGTDSAKLEDLGQRKVQTVRHACFVPRLCQSLARVQVTNIAAGFAHSLASSASGAVYSCGYNDNGQLGTGSRRNSADFQRVQALDAYVIEHIACGQQHSLACSRLRDGGSDDSGVVFSWGLGILGQLGTGINISWLPMRVTIDEPIVSVAAGSHHSVAVSTTGRVYSWGHSEYGQHGAGELFYDLQRGAHYFTPRLQASLEDQRVHVTRVACSSHSTFALAQDGSVYAYGWNAFGVLGVGKYQHSVHPQKVFGLRDSVATHVSAGSNHTAAVVQPRGAHYSLRYDRVLATGAFADVAFVVQDGSSSRGALVHERAHRVVVCARSPYLDGLLRAAAASATDSELFVVETFVDVDAQVFRAFLRFLYTQRVDVASHKRSALSAFATRVCHDALVFACQDAWRRERALDAATDTIERDDVLAFGRDMARMVLAPAFADVVFLWPVDSADSVAFERLHAHKAVLAQVEYFHTMFTGGFSEGAGVTDDTSVHEIALQYMHRDGVSLEAFKHLLVWIYTGAFALLQHLEPNDMMELFVGARLLGLSYLASLCELQLAAILASLDVDSVRACLDFAERFDARRLETLARQLLTKRGALAGDRTEGGSGDEETKASGA